jgi:hypothetical protein
MRPDQEAEIVEAPDEPLSCPRPGAWRIDSRRLRCSSLGAALLASITILSELATPPAHAASIERLEIGRTDLAVFVLDGQIVGGETIALERELSVLPSQLPVAVVLNSPGGSLVEGLKLGLMFYQANIPTFTMGFGGLCASACSLAFLGGRDRVTGKPSRFKMVNSRLGFHQFNVRRTEEQKSKVYKKADIDAAERDTRLTIFVIISYLKEIGEDMSKLHLILKAPSENMNFITDEEAVALGIHVMGEDSNDFIEATRVSERIKAR